MISARPSTETTSGLYTDILRAIEQYSSDKLEVRNILEPKTEQERREDPQEPIHRLFELDSLLSLQQQY